MPDVSQYDVWTLRDGGHVLIVQHDLVDHAITRAVLPLGSAEVVRAMNEKMHARIEVNGQAFHLMPFGLATVAVSILKDRIGNASDHHDAITRTLDLLFHGV